MKHFIFACIFLTVFSFSPACSAQKKNGESVREDKPIKELPNPACRHCIEKGFKLESVTSPETGLVTYYLCVNPENGRKCEVWKFYRKECSLSKK